MLKGFAMFHVNAVVMLALLTNEASSVPPTYDANITSIFSSEPVKQPLMRNPWTVDGNVIRDSTGRAVGVFGVDSFNHRLLR